MCVHIERSHDPVAHETIHETITGDNIAPEWRAFLSAVCRYAEIARQRAADRERSTGEGSSPQPPASQATPRRATHV